MPGDQIAHIGHGFAIISVPPPAGVSSFLLGKFNEEIIVS